MHKKKDMTLRGGEPLVPGIIKEALSRIKILLDTLFETAQDAIFLMDGMRFVDCNPVTLRMFGCEAKTDILGETPFRFSPDRQPDGASSAERAGHLIAAAMTGVPQYFEWRHCRLDRTEFDVEIRLNRCFVGGAPFLVAVVRDITARKQAEAALRRQHLADDLMNKILGRIAGFIPSRFDADVDDALRDLAKFIGVDHAYFFMISPDRATYSCTHETCGPGVAPLREHLQNVPFGTHAWIELTLLAGKARQIDSASDRPRAGAAEDWGSGADVGRQSLLLLPTSGTSGEFAGAIGVDSHDRQTKWSDTDVMLCSIVGNMLTVMNERKRTADRLLQEKQFSDGLIDSLPGTFYLYDSKLRLRRWNKNHESSMGYTAEELQGKKMEDWPATEEHRRRVLAAAQRLLQHGEEIEPLETELLNKDGSAVPYLVSGARIDSPDGPMLVGVAINIAARIRAERALAASERNYRELFNATNDGLFIHDDGGRVLDVNERACAMFGFDAAGARRSPLVELSPGEPPYSQRDAIEKLHRAISEGPQVFDWQSRRLDGTTFWSEVALRAFRIEGEVRVIASVRDITERKRAGLERERLMAELHAANSAKDQFMAVLSHELRNPLAAIQASIDLLQRLPTLDEPRASPALQIIERNVKLQTQLVNDLLDLSRLVQGKLTLERAPMQLGDVVLSAAETCRADAGRAKVSLETRAEPGLWVDADSTRLQQIVMNLVDNAIKFTPKGGRVTVSVTAKERHGYVVVEDTGVGIDADRLADIFEMFRQGDVAAHRTPGLGIGLALVKSIVDLHGSRVWAESAGPGRGSRFIVELPLCEAPAARTAQEVAVSGRTLLKILLVEDNSDTRTMLAETLSQLDYKVVPAESAEAALEILAREPVDVILADMGLPGMDGYEFLRRARRLPAAAQVPALALTGYGQ